MKIIPLAIFPLSILLLLVVADPPPVLTGKLPPISESAGVNQELVPVRFTNQLVTNWVTVSRTFPVVPVGEQNFAVLRYTMANQHGTILSNTMAIVTIRKKDHTVLVESSPVGELNRTVPDPDQLSFGTQNVHFP